MDFRIMFLFSFCLGIALISQGDALDCYPCELVRCKQPTGCNYGTTPDVCQCCERCAKGPGEECGGAFNISGICASDMVCVGGSETTNDPGHCACPKS